MGTLPTAGAGVGRGPKKRGNPVIDSLHGRHTAGTTEIAIGETAASAHCIALHDGSGSQFHSALKAS